MGKNANRFEKVLDGLHSQFPGLRDRCDRERFTERVHESEIAIRHFRRGRRAWGDPIEIARAASDREEATWLAFLATHLGWDVPFSTLALYRAFRERPYWTWHTVSANRGAFAEWVREHSDELMIRAPFGNHRKYQTHRPVPIGTPAVAHSYLDWVTHGRDRSQVAKIATLVEKAAGREDAFRLIYQEVHKHVTGFGRTASYDFVRLLGYLGLADVQPGRCYLDGATGPKEGARQMFGGRLSLSELEDRCKELGCFLGVGLDVIEDALCNWQKSQNRQVRHCS